MSATKLITVWLGGMVCMTVDTHLLVRVPANSTEKEVEGLADAIVEQLPDSYTWEDADNMPERNEYVQSPEVTDIEGLDDDDDDGDDGRDCPTFIRGPDGTLKPLGWAEGG
jgi:hypothetical protein